MTVKNNLLFIFFGFFLAGTFAVADAAEKDKGTLRKRYPSTDIEIYDYRKGDVKGTIRRRYPNSPDIEVWDYKDDQGRKGTIRRRYPGSDIDIYDYDVKKGR